MPPVIPYIPQRITVHLGPPNSDAENVTVSFVDYVKNVAVRFGLHLRKGQRRSLQPYLQRCLWK